MNTARPVHGHVHGRVCGHDVRDNRNARRGDDAHVHSNNAHRDGVRGRDRSSNAHHARDDVPAHDDGHKLGMSLFQF